MEFKDEGRVREQYRRYDPIVAPDTILVWNHFSHLCFPELNKFVKNYLYVLKASLAVIIFARSGRDKSSRELHGAAPHRQPLIYNAALSLCCVCFVQSALQLFWEWHFVDGIVLIAS